MSSHLRCQPVSKSEMPDSSDRESNWPSGVGSHMWGAMGVQARGAGPAARQGASVGSKQRRKRRHRWPHEDFLAAGPLLSLAHGSWG